MTDWSDVQFDVHGCLVDVTQRADPGPPPDITWTALELWALTDLVLGAAVAVSDFRGVQYNMAVASEIFTDEAGIWVRVVSRVAYQDWLSSPVDERPVTPTPARAVPAKTVWVMHEKPADR